MNQAEVTGLLARALAAVDEAGVEDDLREVAFTTAVALLAGGPLAAPSPTGEAPTTASAPAPAGSTPGGSTGPGLLDKISSGLGVSGDSVRRLFAEKNGAPELIVKSTQLPAATAKAARDICLLVMAARQLGGIDDYTEGEVLRAACKRYGKFDTNNFGKHVASLDNLVLTEGKGASAKRKLTLPGVEEATQLVESYSTASS